MKKVLVIDTNNSINSIIAQALINRYLNNIKAYSKALKEPKEVHSNTIKALELQKAWSDEYYSKGFDAFLDIDFDLIVIVSDIEDITDRFPKRVEIISVVFDEPIEDNLETFIEVTNKIKEKLLPIVRKKLS